MKKLFKTLGIIAISLIIPLLIWGFSYIYKSEGKKTDTKIENVADSVKIVDKKIDERTDNITSAINSINTTIKEINEADIEWKKVDEKWKNTQSYNQMTLIKHNKKAFDEIKEQKRLNNLMTNETNR